MAKTTEAEDGIDADKKLGEVTAGELLGLVMYAMDLHGKGAKTGDPLLMKMTVSEFTAHMLNQMKTRAYATANAETAVAERILEDWQGLMEVSAISQPFRIDSMEEAARLAADMGEWFRKDPRIRLAVAVAVVVDDRVYAPSPATRRGIDVVGKEGARK